MKIGYFVIIILMIALTLSLASCTPTDNGTPGDNTDTPDSDIGGVTDGDAAEDESVLALVTDGKAAFRFVTTSSSDSQIIKKVDRIMNSSENISGLYEDLDSDIMELYGLSTLQVLTIKKTLETKNTFLRRQ